jgi:hypothetical protein
MQRISGWSYAMARRPTSVVCVQLLVVATVTAPALVVPAKAQSSGTPDSSQQSPTMQGLPACRELLDMRDETRKHGDALQAAGKNKASPEQVCKLFKVFIAAESEMLKGMENRSALCRNSGRRDHSDESNARDLFSDRGQGLPGGDAWAAVHTARSTRQHRRLLETRRIATGIWRTAVWPVAARCNDTPGDFPRLTCPNRTGCAACAPRARCSWRRSGART